MKKYKRYGLLIAMLLALTITQVNATSTCEYADQIELSSMATSVKVTYEIGAMEIDEDTYEDENGDIVNFTVDTININILNVTEEIYVEVIRSDNTSNKELYYYSSSNNGNILIVQTDINTLYSYTINIYSNKTDCLGDLLRTITLDTPIYNEFSESGWCEQLTDFYYCQEYVFQEINITEGEFNNLAYEEANKTTTSEEKVAENDNFFQEIVDFLQENRIIISIFIVVLIGGAIVMIAIQRRKKI